jgi:hypothetical protein
MTEIEKKTGMTDAECEYLDNMITNSDFEPGPNLVEQGVRPGFARNTLLLSDLDWEVVEYVRSQAAATHRTHAQIISDLVRRELKAAV